MNWAKSQREAAWAGRAVIAAAGITENSRAVNIIAKPTMRLDLMEFSSVAKRHQPETAAQYV
jgi:hypothetical protein